MNLEFIQPKLMLRGAAGRTYASRSGLGGGLFIHRACYKEVNLEFAPSVSVICQGSRLPPLCQMLPEARAVVHLRELARRYVESSACRH